jgi:hypothetical protein
MAKAKPSTAVVPAAAAGVPATYDAHVANLPADVRKQLEDDAAKMKDRIGAPSGDKIRITKKKTFKLPDGQESAGPLRVVVLDFVSYNAFYDRPFSEGDKTPPACFALGAVKPTDLAPSNSSPDKQSAACKGCPNNEFGSKGKGKACSNHYLLAVVEDSDNADAPIFLLQVSPTAVRHWEGYASQVAAKFGLGPICVSTEIYFDPSSDSPSLRFGNPEANKNIGIHAPRKAAATARLLTEPDVSGYEKPGKKGRK